MMPFQPLELSTHLAGIRRFPMPTPRRIVCPHVSLVLGPPPLHLESGILTPMRKTRPRPVIFPNLLDVGLSVSHHLSTNTDLALSCRTTVLLAIELGFVFPDQTVFTAAHGSILA